MNRLLSLLLPLAACGCLANTPRDDDPAHLDIPWRPDFAAARADAERTGKPILLCMVGGDITDAC